MASPYSITISVGYEPGFSMPWVSHVTVAVNAPDGQTNAGFGPIGDAWTNSYGAYTAGKYDVQAVGPGESPTFIQPAPNSNGDLSSDFSTVFSHSARDDSGRRIVATKREVEEIGRFSLGVVAAHGVIDPYFYGGTYLSFAGVPKDKPKRVLAALDLVAPVLHTLFLGKVEAAPPAPVVETTELTARQRELVDLALQGLSDREIGVRLGISHHTVGNHFSVIFAKLGIRKRTQLAALMK